MAQSQRWCLDCEDYTPHVKEMLSFGMGCLLILVSCLVVFVVLPCGGILLFAYAPLFLVGWLSIAFLILLFAPWRCQRCGGTGNPMFEPEPRRPPVHSKVVLGSLQRISSAARRAPTATRRALSRIRKSLASIDRGIRIAWASVEAAYARLPEWAQPIVWGLGLSLPPAVVAIGIWTVAQL